MYLDIVKYNLIISRYYSQERNTHIFIYIYIYIYIYISQINYNYTIKYRPPIHKYVYV